MWMTSPASILTRMRFAESPASIAELSQITALTAQRPPPGSKKAIRWVLPIVTRTASRGPTGPQFWTISSAAESEAKSTTKAPAAASFKKLRESVNIGISVGLQRSCSAVFYMLAQICGMAIATRTAVATILAGATETPPDQSSVASDYLKFFSLGVICKGSGDSVLASAADQ